MGQLEKTAKTNRVQLETVLNIDPNPDPHRKPDSDPDGDHDLYNHGHWDGDIDDLGDGDTQDAGAGYFLFEGLFLGWDELQWGQVR